MTVTHHRLGRQYCAVCHVVRVYVAHVEATILRCPVCDTPTTPAHQEDEDERR